MATNLNQELVNEIYDKFQIARHVVSKRNTAFILGPKKSRADRIARTICYYTAVDRHFVDQVMQNLKPRKTFLDWQGFNAKKLHTPISFEIMRQAVINLYVINKQVPTKDTLLEALRMTTLEGEDNQRYLKKFTKEDMNSLGFIWRRLPKSNKYICVEKTEQFSRRMKYLQQMKEYRDSNRVLIHLERTSPFYVNTSEQRQFNTEIIIGASPQLGLIHTCFPPKQSNLDFWLKNKLNAVPKNSVFVIEMSGRGLYLERKQNCVLPTIHSQKKTMMEWLDANNIPYDSSLHKGELFTLIEKYKVLSQPEYRCCEIIKAAGHDVVLRPPELAYIKYFTPMLAEILENECTCLIDFKSFVIAYLNSISQTIWLEEDRMMAVKEKTIFEEDQKLELILDRLMESIKCKTVSVSDFEECEENEFDSEFYNSIICDASAGSLELLNPSRSTAKVTSSEPNISEPDPSKPGPSNRI